MCRSEPVVSEDNLLLAAAVICAASYLLDQSKTDRVRAYYNSFVINSVINLMIYVTPKSEQNQGVYVSLNASTIERTP